MRLNSRLIVALGAVILLSAPLKAQNPEVKWDSKSLFIGGKRVMPVMGEVHYSRIPADEWRTEVKKDKGRRSDPHCRIRVLEPCGGTGRYI